MSDFKDSLKTGKVGESQIADWAKNQGFHVLPIYEVAEGQYRGPVLFLNNGESLIAPDMLLFKDGDFRFVEAKYKNSGRWQTGIDGDHFYNYLTLKNTLGVHIWILFLHRGGTAIGMESSPTQGESPSGLFGNEIDFLSKNIHHIDGKRGKRGMVYWNMESLQKLADYPF
jgi:hypothetical protein